VVCLGAFGIFSITDGEEILFGDTFLRSAYIVCDLEDKRVGLVPIKFGSTASNIVEIVKCGGFGASNIASSVRVPQTGTEVAARDILRTMGETDCKRNCCASTGQLGSFSVEGKCDTKWYE
jgi:Eukaryotic aspartyl protease